MIIIINRTLCHKNVLKKMLKLRKPSILVVNWVSSWFSFFLSAFTTATTYIFTARTCKTTIITLEPCALNAETQHFILRFNKNFITLHIPLKQRPYMEIGMCNLVRNQIWLNLLMGDHHFGYIRNLVGGGEEKEISTNNSNREYYYYYYYYYFIS